MPEIDKSFLESIEREQESRKKSVRARKRLVVGGVILGVLILAGLGAAYLIEQATETRELPPPPPPVSPQPTIAVSQQAKETGKNYYLEHTEIRSALAEYARQVLKGDLRIESLGGVFQPVAEVSWDKWYYDTVPVREGFKTHKDPQPTAHPFVEDHLITYTIQPDDRWGAWGVGIKYAAALGIDITNPADQEVASLVAAYVWLQSENRLLYDKRNYFDEKGNFDPKGRKLDINFLRAGETIMFTHLSPEALKELAQSPAKYLEGKAPSLQPPPQPPSVPSQETAPPPPS